MNKETYEEGLPYFFDLMKEGVSTDIAATIAFSGPKKFPVKETAEAVERLWRQMESLQSELRQTRELLSQASQPTTVLQTENKEGSVKYPYLFALGFGLLTALFGCFLGFIAGKG